MGTKHYDKAFKENAVKLSYKSVSVSQCARNLGITDSQLHKWRKSALEYGANSFPGRGNERLTDEQREIKRLRKELEDSKLDYSKKNDTPTSRLNAGVSLYENH